MFAAAVPALRAGSKAWACKVRLKFLSSKRGRHIGCLTPTALAKGALWAHWSQGRAMNLEMLRDEYDRARRYTQSLYADLPEADVQWRPAPKSSGIGWHLGHQAAVNHFLVRNLLAAEPSLNPQLASLFAAVTPEEQRGTLPPLRAILTYREAIAHRTHTHLEALLAGTRPA